MSVKYIVLLHKDICDIMLLYSLLLTPSSAPTDATHGDTPSVNENSTPPSCGRSTRLSVRHAAISALVYARRAWQKQPPAGCERAGREMR